MRSPLVWAVLLSSFAVSLAQPNDLILLGNPFLGLVAWVPLFWALERSASNRSAAGLGALFGLVTTVLQNYWLSLFPDFGAWAVTGVVLGVTGYGALLGPVLRTLLAKKGPVRPFAVGALWAVFEYLKGNGFLGFPWGLAPYPFHQWTWMIQIVDVAGLSLLTFLIVSWNAWLVDVVNAPRSLRWATAAFFAVAVVGLAVYGNARINEPRPSRGTVALALVQQNGDPWNSGDEIGPLTTSVEQSRQALRAADPDPDLVVWSETALRWPLQEWRPYYERLPAESPLFKTIRAHDSWWLFGNPYFQDFDLDKSIRGGLVNATVLMNNQAQIVDYYGKIQQVPFAEYIPFFDVPFVKSFFQDVVGLGGSWDLGRQWTEFRVPVRGPAQSVTFGTPICFEDAFPWLNSLLVRNGAELLVNLTNDSWSKRDSSQYQHYVAAMFRAVENRVTLVRSTNSGASLVVDPVGRIVAGPLPSFQPAQMVVKVDLPKHRTLTPYTLFGDWLVAVFAALLIWSLVREPIRAWRRL
jgi:apolipoprotein N-acyltransferase